jgi:hypothetical protein
MRMERLLNKACSSSYHQGTPLPDFSTFAPNINFLAFFPSKLESTTLIFLQVAYSRHSLLNEKGEFEIRVAHTNKK